jgi:hypothetical protein
MHALHKLTGRRCFNRSLWGVGLLGPIAYAFGIRSLLADDKPEAPVPGAPKKTKSKVLDTSADVLQSKKPLDAMSEFLNGFHFYADDMGRQVEANHFCTHLNEDFHQCVIYDSGRSDAKLIGIEYIVSARIFKTLADEEKRFWHSHHYEVKSGELIAPGIPAIAEHGLMEDLVTTYGKTWHCWQIDRDPNFPLGIPQLMMGFTKDGQIDQQLLRDRDRRFDISSDQRRNDRADIEMRTVLAGANSWQSGRVLQLKAEEVPVRNIRSG